MNIELNGGYRIVSDDKQFILKKDDKNIAYQGYLHQIIESYYRHRTLDSNATSIAQLLDEIKELKYYIKLITKETLE